jgi:hypothetical protein
MRLDASANGIESVTHRNRDIFIAMMIAGEQFLSGEPQINTHLINVALAVMVAGRLDGHVTTHQIRGELFKLFDPTFDEILQPR